MMLCAWAFSSFQPRPLASSALFTDSHLPDRESFLNTSKWIEEVRNERGKEVIMMLCGNKNDMEDQRAVSYQEGESKAQEFEMMFIETSAKAGSNVKVQRFPPSLTSLKLIP